MTLFFINRILIWLL